MPAKTIIQFRRDTAANWTSANPTLAAGEAGYETDTAKLKFGDGSTAWSSLAYFGGSGTGTISVSSPITYSGGVIGFDQSAQNTTNDARYARLGAANAFTVGGHSITAEGVAVVPLTLTGATGQTANLLNVGPNFKVDANSNFLVRRAHVGTTTYTANVSLFVTGSASEQQLVVRGAASQTADLQQWQDSTGSVLAFVNSSGSMRSGSFGALASGKAYLQPNADTGGMMVLTNAAANKGLVIQAAASQTADLQQWQISNGTVRSAMSAYGQLALRTDGTWYGGSLDVGTVVTTGVNIIVRATPSQTGDLQQWQNSAGTVLAKITSDGYADVKGFTTGGQGFLANNRVSIGAGSATVIPLIVQGYASQTANLQEWQDSAGTVLGAFSPAGVMRASIFANTSTGFPTLTMNADTGAVGVIITTASHKGLIVRGAASQSTNLQEWQNDSGTVLARVGANGAIATSVSFGSTNSGRAYLGPDFDTNGLGIVTNGAANKGLIIRGAASQTANLLEIQNSVPSVLAGVDNVGRMFVREGSNASGASLHVGVGGNTSIVAIVARGAASQTANLTEWQDSTGTVNAYVNASGDVKGRLLFAYTTTNMSASLNVAAATASNIGAVIRGYASQTANLTEWQDSTGTVLTRVNANGYISAKNGVYAGTTPPTTGYMGIDTSGAANVGMIVKGYASQTGDLQQWQNSAGTVLAKIESNGGSNAPFFNVNNNVAALSQVSSGGTLTLYKATSANANPGANYGRIYFRDGTYSGTLKLVVRAGASGNEVTVLDNIDQAGTFTIAPQLVTTNAQTGTTYTLALSDMDKMVEMSNASAITLTVPPNSGTGSVAFPVGTKIDLLQTGAGQVTVAPGTGVTINGTPGLKFRAQWSAASLVKRATDTWVLIGDLSA